MNIWIRKINYIKVSILKIRKFVKKKNNSTIHEVTEKISPEKNDRFEKIENTNSKLQCWGLRNCSSDLWQRNQGELLASLEEKLERRRTQYLDIPPVLGSQLSPGFNLLVGLDRNHCLCSLSSNPLLVSLPVLLWLCTVC